MSLAKIQPLIQSPDNLEVRLKEIPPEAGVYLMRDAQDQILYIGKAKNLRSRVRSYFRDSANHSSRIALMVGQVCEIEFIVTDTEAEALALEANLIKKHQPYFNILLKDDKKYPYVCITWSKEYPQIFITRKRKMGSEKDRYYGPYVDARALRETLNLIQQLFPLQQRPKPLFKDRPCLNFDLGRCPGICQQLISPEQYRQTVQKVAMIFQGRTEELIESLAEQMQQAADNLNFEMAARLRDRIQALKSLGVDQKVSLPDDRVSRDAIALAANPRHSCIQLFQIRSGKLVGRLGFVSDVRFSPEGIEKNQSFPEIELSTILQKVLEEHYQTVESVEIPSEILVQYDLPDSEILSTWLSEKRGRKVSIFSPQRQGKAELISLVQRNAEYELSRIQNHNDRQLQSLQDLADILKLPNLPHRIEGYDISHVQGAHAVASRVVFIDGIPAKQHYRHYKIRNPEVQLGHSDDFASLAEVIGRRFRDFPASNHRRMSETLPDLLMIDGGKGQLSSVVAVLQELGILDKLRVVSLAKQREEIFLPGESLPLPTHPEQPGVQLLRRLRDEAHRFAVSFHRQQRTERMRRSRLDEIPGLGLQRQKELLAHFRSIDYIGIATPEQIAEVPGIGRRLAQQIYDYFHP